MHLQLTHMMFCVFLTLLKCLWLTDFGILKQKDTVSMLH